MNTNHTELFSIPVGVWEREKEISKEEINFVSNVEYKKNVRNHVDRDYKAFNRKELKDIGEFCQMCVDSYAKDFYKVTTKFRIHISWCNKTKPNESHHPHTHPNSVFSGVYYFQDLKDCPIRLYNPNTFTQNASLNIFNKDGFSEWNQYNSSSWAMTHIKKNSCIIFPSWLQHDVSKNVSGENRYSIAFNAYFDSNQTVGIETTSIDL